MKPNQVNLFYLSYHPESNSGDGFSISIFNRYHHQKSRVVEYSANMSVGVSKHNKASVSEIMNKHTKPFGEEVAAENTFSFSNNFATSDELAFGVAGTVNLDADSYTFRRRLTSSVFSLNISLNAGTLTSDRNVDKTTTSSGRERVHRPDSLCIYQLRRVDIPEQILPDLE